MLIFPLLIAICLVYKGTKVDQLRHLPKEAARLFVQIVVVMTLAALAISLAYWALAKWA